jgi:hypothetical protein
MTGIHVITGQNTLNHLKLWLETGINVLFLQLRQAKLVWQKIIQSFHLCKCPVHYNQSNSILCPSTYYQKFL